MQPFLSNPFQLQNCLIKYTANKTLITDMNGEIKDSFGINYTNGNPFGDPFDHLYYNDTLVVHFNKILSLQGELYAMIRDTLYKVDFNNFTSISCIPENRSKSPTKICLFNNNIIVTNERTFYKLQNNAFEEIQFFYNNRELTPDFTILYDFNEHATMAIRQNGIFMILEIGEQQCKLLFSGSCLIQLFANSGLQVFQIDDAGSKLIIDYTQEQLELSYRFENFDQKIVYNNYVTEYSTETMNIILSDYEGFSKRRNIIYERMQAKLPSKVTLESVKHKFYQEITPNEYIFQNSYQLKDNLIFYKGEHAYITDMNRKVLQRIPLVFILSQNSTQRFRGRFSIERYNCYHKLWYCNNTVYALLNDVLFSVDLFKFKELQKIPGEYSSGYVRICIYNDQILTTNEKQFFLYDPKINKFREKKFFIENKQIVSRDVGLYSYDNNAIARIYDDNKQYIALLKEGECEILHIGTHVQNLTPAQGIWPFDLGYQTCGIVDLSSTPVQIRYCSSQLNRIQFIFSNNSIDYPQDVMQNFVDETYFERRDQIYQQQRSSLKFSQLDQVNKFGRIDNKTIVQSFVDIFSISHETFDDLIQLQSQQYIPKQIKNITESFNFGEARRVRQFGNPNDFIFGEPRPFEARGGFGVPRPQFQAIGFGERGFRPPANLAAQFMDNQRRFGGFPQ
ncbi:Conserved_hypothetical protein [Hexamita inflata]|uniref:Uncharacterized protein n=1 Tax=Hexamita inflata TaxID=28002 RepID=A0ABP1H6A9_9EUKA